MRRPGNPQQQQASVIRRLLITLVVLALLFVLVDRVGNWTAERIAADNLQSSQHLDKRPDVDIHGFPFVNQFASGHYDHISVDADDVPVAKAHIDISHLQVDLNQVTVSRDFADYHVKSATADGTISYAELSSVLGVTVSYAGDGRIKASKSFTILGHTIRPTIGVRPRIANGVLKFSTSYINGADQTAGNVTGAMKDLFDLSVPLQGIPFEVTLRSLQVDDKGLELHLVGSDLHYRKT